ncbi:MAG TPA: tetratricopeptide repeat protein [Rhizomicrobium sp.]|nr:tetratricopeptide repeat protein [Rhizomicrobium sp.]
MDVKALNQQAAEALQSGDLARADTLIGQLCAAQPDHPLSNYLLGALRIRQGRSAEALAPLEAAYRAKPDNISVLLHLGNALQDAQRFEEAVTHYDRALELKPDFSDALNNRGNALAAQGKTDAALASFDAALAIDAGDAGIWYNRGDLLRRSGRYQEAIACFDRALKIRPDHADAWSHKGTTLVELRQPALGLACLDRAVALQPGDPAFGMNRAAIFFHMGAFDRALTEYDRVRALAPDFPKLFGRIALTTLYQCDWARMDKIAMELPARVRAGETGLDPWTLISYGCGNELLRMCARNVMRAAIPEPPPPLWKGERYAHDRIRLAYVSADFRTHPVGFQLAGLLERHDRSRFELIAISSGEDDGSDTRKRIIAACDQFHDMVKASDREVAEKLRALEIDVAVDLSGHTSGTRVGAFEWRPAPVQATWLGFPGTSGAREMDFLLGDAIVTPPDYQACYDEKIVALPGSFFPMGGEMKAGEPPSRAEAGLPEDGLVFCCFNRNWKISRAVFDIWLRLLSQVPDSVLWLREYTPHSDAALRRYAEQNGIDAGRLIFAGRVPMAQHMARHALADLFLDTLPYGAHATAADALWAGLPVLTQLGGVFAGRVGASLLAAAGLPELITRSPEDYEATALDLARDRGRLSGLREKLVVNRANAPLFDMARFTRNLEAAYEAMLREKS